MPSELDEDPLTTLTQALSALHARVRALEATVHELKWRWVMPLALLMPLVLLWLATLAH